MKCFDIGWIPKGWTRGDPLQVNHYPNGPSFVATISNGAPVDYADMRPISSDHAAFVLVPSDEYQRAKEWLDWWNETAIG